MNRYVDKDLGEVSECVSEQSFLGNPNRQVDGAQAKALGSAGGKSLAENGTGTLTEKVGEENKPISRRYHEEESSWLRRTYDGAIGFVGRNKFPFGVLVGGQGLDSVGTYGFLRNGDQEVHSVSNYLISELGKEVGVAIVTVGSITLISLLAAGIRNIAINRFGEDTILKDIDRTIMYLGGISRFFAGIDHFYPNLKYDFGRFLGMDV